MTTSKDKRKAKDKEQKVKSEIDNIRSMKAARDRKRQIEKLVQDVADLQQNFINMAQRMDQIVRTVRELTRANNSASVVINCIEKHLDATAEGWDDGARAAVERRSELLKERAALAQSAQRGDLEPEDRRDLGRQLWGIAKELGTEATDIPMVLSIYLQARDLTAAQEFVAEVRNSGLEISKDVDEVISQLEARIDELKAEIGEKPTIVAP